MFENEAQAKFVEDHLKAALSAPRTVFTPEIMDQIGAEFGIAAEVRDVIGQVLEFGAREYASEAEWAALEFERIRKDLHALERAAKSLLDAFANVSPQTQWVLHEVGVARRLNGFDLPHVSALDGDALLHYAAPADQPPLCISLADVRSILAALGQCASDARPAAKASRKGRPVQQGLWDLLHAGFHIWSSGLGRPFKLDWASDGEPITDAARFCVRIAHVVDPSLALGQIKTVSRKVREEAMVIRNLSEMPKGAEHYRKRFE